MATISKRIQQLLEEETKSRGATSSAASDEASFVELQTVSQDAIRSTLALLFAAPAADWQNDSAVVSIWVQLLRRQQKEPIELEPSQIGTLEQVYGSLTTRPALQALLLRWLACSPSKADHQAFARLMVEQPLVDPRLLIEVFGDLVSRARAGTVDVFPRLLDGIQHRQLAGFVLDLANHLYRQGLAETHPATPKMDQLSQLLSGIATRLGKLQESRPTTQEQVADLGRQVTESVSLGVSLCDALGLIGDAAAVAALNQALAVDHRRLRVEAAAALARLKHPDGSQILLGMAAEPAERIRVLAYAEELGLSAEVPDQFASHVARAEAEFVLYLSQPTLFGLPPQHIELVAEKTQHWPGYEEPRNCYLFQFVYRFPNGEFTNIGIAGPVVFSLHADLTSLSYDDVFAIFAGWHVQHPEIYAIDAGRTVGQDQLDLQRLTGHLRAAAKYSHVDPARFGHFLGQRVLVAAAQRGTSHGWVTVSDDALTWLPAGNPEHPLGAEEAFQLFVGRALLHSFN